MHGDRNQITGYFRGFTRKGQEEHSGVIQMFYILMWGQVTQIYVFVKTDPTTYKANICAFHCM